MWRCPLHSHSPSRRFDIPPLISTLPSFLHASTFSLVSLLRLPHTILYPGSALSTPSLLIDLCVFSPLPSSRQCVPSPNSHVESRDTRPHSSRVFKELGFPPGRIRSPGIPCSYQLTPPSPFTLLPFENNMLFSHSRIHYPPHEASPSGGGSSGNVQLPARHARQN